jgi:NAD(P)H-hydrate epimerase
MVNQFNSEELDQIAVTAEQMRQIEEEIFAAGMPVAALMEKAATLIAARLQQYYPRSQFPRTGILVGPGHNGGDALVVARELHLQGYQVALYCPFDKLKDLTAQHASYAQYLGIPCYRETAPLQDCDFMVDGLFGFGLERPLSGTVATAIDELNQWGKPIASIDIPSGLHTDTGAVLGTAVRASQTFCLGLWKLGLFQDSALDYLGRLERLDFGIPAAAVWAVLPQPAPVQIVTKARARLSVPLQRPPTTHKYRQGHLLLICGSRRYAGGTILTGLGARASGVGMLSLAVPESLQLLVVSHLPDALTVGCPETAAGAIAELAPLAADFSRYDAVACGPGLTLEAVNPVQAALTAACPLVLDADGLNVLAQLGTASNLAQRQFPTVLTPHAGEFKRLFPDLPAPQERRIEAVQAAARESGATVLLKGARTAIAAPEGSLRLMGESTPALARGGSGDVLTGLIGGLLAQIAGTGQPLAAVVAAAAWWHAQAGILAAQERTELGVDAHTLSQYLHRVWCER